ADRGRPARPLGPTGNVVPHRDEGAGAVVGRRSARRARILGPAGTAPARGPLAALGRSAPHAAAGADPGRRLPGSRRRTLGPPGRRRPRPRGRTLRQRRHRRRDLQAGPTPRTRSSFGPPVRPRSTLGPSTGP